MEPNLHQQIWAGLGEIWAGFGRDASWPPRTLHLARVWKKRPRIASVAALMARRPERLTRRWLIQRSLQLRPRRVERISDGVRADRLPSQKNKIPYCRS